MTAPDHADAAADPTNPAPGLAADPPGPAGAASDRTDAAAGSVVLMGVSGSGKTTVGRLLADRLGIGFVDGDDLHPPANRAAMAAGRPLTDADRGPWLTAIGARLDRGEPVVLACSGLRRAYRRRLARPGVRLVHLDVSRASLAARLAHRTGHFFGPELLDSQLDAAEPPGPDEPVLRVDGERPPATVAAAIAAALRDTTATPTPRRRTSGTGPARHDDTAPRVPTEVAT